MRRATLRLCSIAVGSSAIIGWADELPVETFFRNYQYSEVKLSPDGNYLGVLAPNSNRVGLAILDMKNQTVNWAYASRVADVGSFIWATTNRLLFRWANKGYMESGFLAVDRDGSHALRLVGEGGRLREGHTGLLSGEHPGSRPIVWGTRFLGLLPNSPDEILVASFEKGVQADGTLIMYQNVFRMNILTGKMTLDTINPGHVVQWVMDHNGLVRIGLAREGARLKILHRL